MNNINYQILYKLILNNFVAYLKIFFVLVFINIAYFFIKAPTYTSKVSFYATYNDVQEGSLFSPLSSLMGSTNSLNFSISDYIKSEKMMQELVEKEYIINGKKETLIDFWGSDFINFYDFNPLSYMLKINKHFNLNPSLSDFDKKTFFAKETLSDKIDFSENRITSIYSISVTIGKYPSLSKEIVENAYNSILSYVGQIENSKASEKISFINGRLNQVSLELKEAENEKLIFLQNNKRPFSASLILTEQRIQRKINLHSDVYTNLSNQLELAKINQKDNTSSIFILDEANLASEKDGQSLLKSIIILFLLSFISFYLFIIYKNINQIILTKK